MMDDGSGKCLLDVINDPTALQEFLRSNSQDNSLLSKSSPEGAISRSSYVNLNRLATPTLNTSATRTTGVTRALPTNTRVASLGPGTSSANINPSVAPQSTFVNAVVNNNSFARTSGNVNAPFNVGIVPSSVPVSTGVSFLKTPGLDTTSNAVNKVGSAGLGTSASSGIVTVPKPVVTSASTFQGKKPIPIQPKTPSVSSAVSSSTVGSPGNRGMQVINSGLPLVSHAAHKQSAAGQQSVSPGHRVALNGIDSKANVRTNVASGNVHTIKSSPGILQPILSTTPVKRIAPKQPSILPQTGMSSPPQMVGTQHKILLQQVSNQITPQVQTVVNQVSPGNVQQQNHTQLIQAQQLLNLIRNQTPASQTTQQTSPQLVQSQPLPANQIKQIQQLVQQKLSNQQQQPQVVQTVQQKVLSPAQLQAALKQKPQLMTQTVQPAQPQNIVIQEEVIKQLLQQVAQHKSAQNVVQSQQLFQQVQQQSQPVQKQIIVQNVQPQSLGQGQQNTQSLQVNVSAPGKHTNVNQRPNTAASPVSIQLQQVLNNQQKQAQHIIGQQQVNLTPQQQITKDQGARLLQGVTFVQNQPNKTSTAQVLNQGGIVQQVNSVIQQGKSGTTPIVQIVTTTQQNTLPQTQQAQNTGVQKVFIIKQPELLQKLGLQGAKTQQTIQITPQQLQALKQFQLQQQAAKQKLTPGNLQTGSNVQAKTLTPDQLKQLQLQQQLQGSGVKQVIVQSRTQPVLQQQRQVNVKTPGKMQHIPRILQTSGRQPVSQSVKVSVPIKQETSKGVKRPHSSDTADVPKAATRLKQGLAQDQQAVLRPDIKTAFTSREDVIKRLTPYHVCYDPSPTPDDVQKADNLFGAVSTQLVKRSQKMMEKYRQLLFDESMREHPSAEMVMLYRVFLTNERAALAEERKLAKENPMEILNVIKRENKLEETSSNVESMDTSIKDLPSTKDISPLVTSTTENDFVSSMKNTVSEASSKISSLLNINISPPSRNSLSPKTEISSSTSPLSTRTHSLPTSSSANNHLSSLSSQALYNKQNSQQLKEETEENHVLSSDLPVDVQMDEESEKEDVTATLALLNSMASELDEVLDVEGAL